MAAATAVGAAPSVSTAGEYRTITVSAGESRTFSLGSGDTLENLLIDVTADDADVFIEARGTGWTIRNVGVRGKFDVGDDNNVLDSEYGGGFHQVLNCQGEGVIENVYLGDGVVEGVDRTAMNVGNEHAGHIEMRRCNVGRWSTNAVYAAGFGRTQPPGPTDGAGGTIAVRNCYFHDNNVAHLRLAADGTVVENCTITNTNDVPVVPLTNGGAKNVINSRGIYTGYGDPSQVITVRDCDLEITAENTDGAASVAVSDDHSTFGELSTIHIENSQVKGDLVGDHVETENVGHSPDTSVPSGVPTSAEAAASGGSSSGDGSDSGDDTGGDALSNALSIAGGSPSNVLDYEFAVTDRVEKTTARGATIDADDEISDGTVTGAVAGGVDSYEFAGDLVSFQVAGDPTVYLNGDAVDPARLGSRSNTLTITGGSGSNPVSYTLAVSDTLEKSTANGASINPDDEVCGTFVNGRVWGSFDSYEFTGEITRFYADGDLTVSLNGERVDPGELGGT